MAFFNARSQMRKAREQARRDREEAEARERYLANLAKRETDMTARQRGAWNIATA